MNLLLSVAVALVSILLLLEVLAWHLAAILAGRCPAKYPLLYRPFVALWRLWRKT